MDDPIQGKEETCIMCDVEPRPPGPEIHSVEQPHAPGIEQCLRSLKRNLLPGAIIIMDREPAGVPPIATGENATAEAMSRRQAVNPGNGMFVVFDTTPRQF